jgi:hypothetical protein
LYLCAYAAKECLNDDVSGVNRAIEQAKFTNFADLYQEWVTQFRTTMVVTSKEINRKLNKLQNTPKVPLDHLNFNFYVDDILQAGFHYHDMETEP